jgi:hypothetical protein
MEDITVDINADISGYSSSLTQAIATADQFTKASDNMLGRLNKLNGISISLVKNTVGLTGANKLGTAQAAAYQQQLAKIETSAKVTGKNFGELEKTTKKFARDFPIGIKGAADTVETLQKVGVTTNKEIQKLGKTFIEVGAAAGEFGPELGSNLLQLTRTFGGSTGSLQKFADSLITTTSKFGASASSVLSFSKAIAPVASTVGMSETSVIGLSTAMSRLGEDGFRAANAFNKILIDMSKSIRTGSPEIREYAAVMGMTTEALQSMMKENPTDVVVKFTEAIKSQGTDAIRVLDDLGLEGVSTFRAISALSREGNLGEIIDTASASFGDGSAAEGAATALSGVNDQMMRLQESMSQTVASSGKPFLGYLESVLDVANGISDGVAGIAESDLAQGIGKTVAPVTAGVSAVNTAIGAAATVAFGKTILDGVRKSSFGQEFKSGVGSGAVGSAYAPAANAGRFAQMGGGLGNVFGAVRGPNIVDTPSALARAAQLGQLGARSAGNLLALGNRIQESTINRAMGREAVATPAGTNVRAAASGLGTALRAGDAGAVTTATRGLVASMGQYLTANKGLTVQTAKLTQSFAGAAVAATKFAASAVAKTGGVLTSLGITGPMLAIGAAIAGGMVLKKQGEETIKREEQSLSEGGYAAFNEFAEKAGLATRALSDLSTAVKEATLSLAKENTTREDAFTISSAEASNAAQTNYVSAYEIPKDMRSGTEQEKLDALATSGRLMLGKNPTNEAIAQYLSDVASQKGQTFAQQLADQLKDYYADDSMLMADSLEAIGRESARNVNPLSDLEFTISAMGAELIQGYVSEIQRTSASIGAVDGTGMGQKYMYEEIEKLYNLGQNDTRTGQQALKERQAIARIISQLTGNEVDTNAIAEIEESMTGMGAYEERLSFKDFIKEMESVGYSLGVLGLDLKNVMPEMGQARKDSNLAQLESMFLTGNENLLNLPDILYAAEDAAKKHNVTVAELTDEQLSQLSEVEKLVYEARRSTADPKVQAQAASAVVTEMMKTTNLQDIKTQLLRNIANTTETDDKRSVLTASYSLAANLESLSVAGMSNVEQGRLARERGEAARQPGFEVDAGSRQAYDAAIQGEQDYYNQQLQMMRQFLVQERELNISYANAEEDLQIQRQRARENFERQEFRAERNYNRQRMRAIRDFNIQMFEAQQDFDTQRERTLEQRNRQITRMMEDAASQMYAPFQRIQAKDVFDTSGLVSNLLTQSKAIQEQMDNVRNLMGMGLSQQVVDQLGLGSAENAQQVKRLIADITSNPQLISELNAAVSAKGDVAGEMVTDLDLNKDFRRDTEEFRIGIDNQDFDFSRSIERAVKKMKTSLKDMSIDFKTQMKDASKDFKISMAQMLEDFTRNRNRAYAQLARFGDDMAKLASTDELIKEFAASFNRIPGLVNNEMLSNANTLMKGYSKWLREQATTAMRDIDLEIVIGTIKGNPNVTGQFLKDNLGSAIKSSATTKDLNALIKFMGQYPGATAEIIKKNFPKVFLAEGGIVTRQTDAVIGEAGYPEAVVPLNSRGANMLADAMGRYVSNKEVLNSRVSTYSAPVNSSSNYTYDQKTMFSGPITVQTQNPSDMARQLAARARRNRLARPVGSK